VGTAQGTIYGAELLTEDGKRRSKQPQLLSNGKKEKRRRTLQFDDFPMEVDDATVSDDLLDGSSSTSQLPLRDVAVIEGFVKAICRIHDPRDQPGSLVEEGGLAFRDIVAESPTLVTSVFLQAFSPLFEEIPNQAAKQWLSFINSTIFERSLDMHLAFILAEDSCQTTNVASAQMVWDEVNCIVDSLLFQAYYLSDPKKLQSMSVLLSCMLKVGAGIITRDRNGATAFSCVALLAQSTNNMPEMNSQRTGTVEYLLFRGDGMYAIARPLLTRILAIATFVCHPRGVCCVKNNPLVKDVLSLFEDGPLSG
jgi:hypothetical protein